MKPATMWKGLPVESGKVSSLANVKSDVLPEAIKRRQSSTCKTTGLSPKDIVIRLPPLKDTPRKSQEQVFIRKVRRCGEVYDFTEDANMNEKKDKLAVLKELIAFISEENSISLLKEPSYREIVTMVGRNIFRYFSPIETLEHDIDTDQITYEAAWPHIKLVYSFFHHFLNSPGLNINLTRKYIDQKFITQLLETFNSQDVREREWLKSVVFNIYLKFFERRAFIRKEINNIFLRYVYETEQFYAINELLEIMTTAINSFSIPLKPEHREVMIKVILPLHKPKNLMLYSKQLTDCVKAFLRKDETLVEVTIKYLLRHWPITYSQKEVIFLQEIDDLLNCISAHEFAKIQEPLVKQLSKCISSMHFQVSECALSYWGKVEFVRLVNGNLATLMPFVFDDLYAASNKHWNNRISENCSKLLRLFKDAEPHLYDKLLAAQKAKVKEEIKKPRPKSAKPATSTASKTSVSPKQTPSRTRQSSPPAKKQSTSGSTKSNVKKK